MLILALALAVMCAIQLVCVLALIDQYKGLLQIRASLGLIDATKQIDLSAIREQIKPSAVGLPPLLDQEDLTVAVFLTMKCSTCQTIAEALHGRVSPPLFVVLEGPTQESCSDWLAAADLKGARVRADVGGTIAERLDLHVAPAALTFRGGRLVAAQSLPTPRQLQVLLKSRSRPDGPRLLAGRAETGGVPWTTN